MAVGKKYSGITCDCLPKPDPLPTTPMPLRDLQTSCSGGPIAPPNGSGIIRGHVWDDLDQDGQWGDEAMLASLKVELYEAGTDGLLGTPDDVLVGTDDADPLYAFEELSPGRYRVSVLASTLPTGYVVGTQPPDFVVYDNEFFDSANFGLESP